MRALALGVIAMAGVAWIVTPAGVAGGLALGLPVAFLAPRFRQLRGPLLVAVALAVVGVHAGVLLFDSRAVTSRVLSALIATFAVAPWVFILTFVVWVRSRRPRGPDS